MLHHEVTTLKLMILKKNNDIILSPYIKKPKINESSKGVRHVSHPS